MSDLHNKEQLDESLVEKFPKVNLDKDGFALEDILAEFGRNGTSPAPDPAQAAPTAEDTPAEPAAPAAEDEDADMRIARPRSKDSSGDWREITKDLPVLPKSVIAKARKIVAFPTAEKETAAEETRPASPAPEVDDTPLMRIEQVMSQTVDSVLEGNDDALLDEPVSFQEQLEKAKNAAVDGWQRMEEAVRQRQQRPKKPDWEPPEVEEEEDEPASAEPEPDLETAMREERRSCKRMRRQLLLDVPPVLALVVLSVMHTWMAQRLPAFWMESSRTQALVMGGLLLLSAIAAPVLVQIAWNDLKEKHITCVQAALFSEAVTLLACIVGAIQGRELALPMAAPAALFAWMTLYGRLQTADMHRRMYHLADLGGVPPYSPAMTAAGLCKQRGRMDGFYRTIQRADPQQRAERLLLPLLLIACTVCSGVVCLSGGRMGEFFWVWSAMLTASLALGLPLTAILSLHMLTKRLGRSGAAVAGWSGARSISRAKRMVLTDSDLFPTGTYTLNGMKAYGEEIGKILSYAATMAHASQSPLRPIFDQLLSSEGGHLQEVGEVRYYEEGGVEGVIRGESVVMGSAYCMKKRHVTLPRELKVETGVFLAVDRQLIAIFAIKYQPSRNVEWALRALKRNRIELVLGTRSSNITPGLLKRKFSLDVKPIYPSVSTRLSLFALSEESAPRADGILYREGLMPYAEMVMGSRRCARVVRISTAFAWLSSLAGLLLSYYLTNSAAYTAMGSGYVLAFLLLLLLPVWLLAGMVKIY